MMDRVSRTTIIVGFGLQRDSFIRNATVRLNCNFTRAVGRGQPVTVSLLPPAPFLASKRRGSIAHSASCTATLFATRSYPGRRKSLGGFPEVACGGRGRSRSWPTMMRHPASSSLSGHIRSGSRLLCLMVVFCLSACYSSFGGKHSHRHTSTGMCAVTTISRRESLGTVGLTPATPSPSQSPSSPSARRRGSDKAWSASRSRSAWNCGTVV